MINKGLRLTRSVGVISSSWFLRDSYPHRDLKTTGDKTRTLFLLFAGALHRDFISSTYSPCTVNPPTLNKPCTRMAKTTPYPPCTVTHSRPAYRRVPGLVPGAASGNAYSHNRRAVSTNISCTET